MLISTKVAYIVALVSGATAVNADPFMGALLTPAVIAAAGAGSASAIVVRAMGEKDRPPETIVKRTFTTFLIFLTGAVFGLFMGPSLAGMSALDAMGAAFFGGLVGFGVVGVLTSPKTMQSIGNWIVEMLTRNKGDKP